MPSDSRVVRVIETEVYSRVVGYYRPVQQYNPGKMKEFEDRKFVRLRGADDWHSPVLPDARHPKEVQSALGDCTPEPVCGVRNTAQH
jgi:hypothetical protein